MAKDKNFEVVQKYYFRKNGVVETQGYDWIGEGAEDLYPVELDGKMGFADCNGEIVVPIIYDIQYFWMGNATYLGLQKNKLYGLIKHDGTVVVEFQWEDMKLCSSSEDLIPVAINGKWGFVNVITGQTQIEPVYDKVEFFKDSFAPVCIENKWGMIDKNGTLITKVKYLVDTYFVGEFAIMFEGGSFDYSSLNRRIISNSNCKIINKKGYELVTDCYWIERSGINIFSLQRRENGKIIESIKQFIVFPEYIVVIDNGEYIKGYITTEGKYSQEYVSKCHYYTHAKYTGGGTWSVIDYTGKPINIPDAELQKVKEDLLNN